MIVNTINLNEVVEKPRLPADQPFTFQIIKAELGLAKNANKHTGRQEPKIGCEFLPMDAGWEDRKVYHTFSLAPGALSSDDAIMSIKKFFQTVGFEWAGDGSFSTEDMTTMKFVGTIKYEEGNNFPRLSRVIAGA